MGLLGYFQTYYYLLLFDVGNAGEGAGYGCTVILLYF